MPDWRSLPTKPDEITCAPPYSFFSGILDRHFLAATNKDPLHRICSLTRQRGVNHLVVECALSRPDVIEEISALDRRCKAGGEAQAIAFSFFKVPSGTTKLRNAPDSKLLAHAVLINYKAKGYPRFTHSYVFEAILPPPDRSSVNRTFDFPKTLVLPVQDFECRIQNRTFHLKGVLYCQQNDTLHVCAHSCLRMAIGSSRHSADRISSDRINRLLGIDDKVDSLDSGEIARVINASGMTAAVRTNLKPDEYLAELAALIDSGYLALLGFTTKGNMGHVLTVFGHSRRSDQWHPQALHAYSGPKSAKYLPSSSWIDHFLIHDDNIGPYLSLSARSFTRNQNMQLSCVIGLLPSPAMSSIYAETIASTALRSLLPLLRTEGANIWLKYIGERRDVILRSVLIRKFDYLEHLKRAKGHDGSRIDRATLAKLETLDETFWMVEFSLSPLYTGNRSKLGEVLISAAGLSGEIENVLAIRLPGSLLSPIDADTLLMGSCSLKSHSAIYENRLLAGRAG